MDRTDALLLGLAVAGTAGLALASEALDPPLVTLAELPRWEDHAVAVEALVTQSHAAGSAAQVLRLADGQGSAAAFWSSREPVEGAHVRVEGTVAHYRGAWEVLARRLEVLAPPGSPLGVAQAARLAPALQGREVAVLGTLAWTVEGVPSLEGDGAALRVAAPRAMLEGLADERVLARGTPRYDAASAAFALEAWEVRHA